LCEATFPLGVRRFWKSSRLLETRKETTAKESRLFSQTPFNIAFGHGYLVRGRIFAMILYGPAVACFGADSPEAEKEKVILRDGFWYGNSGILIVEDVLIENKT
jgi:hypothetical protein